MTPANWTATLVLASMTTAAVAAAPYVRCEGCSRAQIAAVAAIHQPTRAISFLCQHDAACFREALADADTPGRLIYVVDFTCSPVGLWSVRADNSEVRAVPLARAESAFEAAVAYVDYFWSRRMSPGPDIIELGSDFPVRSAESLVGRYDQIDKVKEAIAAAIDGARPVSGLLNRHFNRALLEVVNEHLSRQPAQFRVRFPDQSTAIIAMNQLPTIGFEQRVWEAALVPGSLQDGTGRALREAAIVERMLNSH